MSTGTRIPLQSCQPWAPREQIAPRCARSEGGWYTVSSGGSDGCYGGWEFLYPLPASTHVSVKVRARHAGLQRGPDSLHGALLWTVESGALLWEPLCLTAVRGRDTLVFECLARKPADTKSFSVRLLLAWSNSGQIKWSEPVVREASRPRPRPWRLGAAGGPLPPGERTMATNRDAYLGMCRSAAAEKVDLLCLPEVMLSTGLPSSPEALVQQAIEIPGPETEPFQAFARENHMVLCFSAWERNRELVHNTAMLINRSGEIVGKYRKVHLASPLEAWWGVTPGHEFRVHDVGGARVAMNICMDSSVAESSRVPFALGAEIVCLPIMGDHRAVSGWQGVASDFDIERWSLIQRLHAMDNQVYMVISRNTGYGSGVFSPAGEVLAMSGGKQLVHADVDLADPPRSWYGATHRGIMQWVRRTPAYHPLLDRTAVCRQ